MKKNKFVFFFLMTITSTIFSQVKVKEVGLGLSSLNILNTGSYSLNYRWGQKDKLFTISGGLGAYSNFGDNQSTNNGYIDTLLGTGTQNRTENSPYNFNFNLGINSIKLKDISDKLGFFYGFGLGLGVNFNQTNSELISISTQTSSPSRRYESISKNEASNFAIRPSISVPIGVYYKFSNEFRLYAQLSPNVYFIHTENNTKFDNLQTVYENGVAVNSSNIVKGDDNGKQNSFGIDGVSNWNTFFTFVYRWEK